jgi:hypothetical protein
VSSSVRTSEIRALRLRTRVVQAGPQTAEKPVVHVHGGPVVLPDSRHYSPLDSPDRLAGLALTFLRAQLGVAGETARAAASTRLVSCSATAAQVRNRGLT